MGNSACCWIVISWTSSSSTNASRWRAYPPCDRRSDLAIG
jgi:hypothetical protein